MENEGNRREKIKKGNKVKDRQENTESGVENEEKRGWLGCERVLLAEPFYGIQAPQAKGLSLYCVSVI